VPEPAPEQPIYGLKALIDLSSESDNDESKDFMAFIAIAQNILEHNPTSDEGEDVPRFDEEEEEPPAAPPDDDSPTADEPSPPGAFVFGGRALDLRGVGEGDSVGYRTEALRLFLEQGIGLGKFMEAYQFVSEGYEGLEPTEVDAQMRRIFPSPELLAFYPLIQQLVVCEHSELEE
jgi:hypothetical protein